MRNLTLIAALGALASFAMAPGEPHFAPQAGSRVEKRFVNELEMELVRMQNWFGDEEAPEGEQPKLEVRVESRDEVVFVDHYVALDEGRPAQLERRFESARSKNSEHVSSELGDSDNERERQSELDGLTVAFTWNAESDGFDAAFKGEGGDAALLEHLREDTDLRRFLPAAPVEDGATWEVDVLAYDDLISPGGDLVLKDEEGEESDLDEDELRDNLAGKVTAVYAGRREVEGVQVDVIELEFDVRTHGDAEVESRFKGGTHTRSFEVAHQAKGELLWAFELGRAHSLSIEGRATYDVTSEESFEGDEGPRKFKQRMAFAGTLRTTVEFKAVDEQ